MRVGFSRGKSQSPYLTGSVGAESKMRSEAIALRPGPNPRSERDREELLGLAGCMRLGLEPFLNQVGL
jgi:hypothetical protein